MYLTAGIPTCRECLGAVSPWYKLILVLKVAVQTQHTTKLTRPK